MPGQARAGALDCRGLPGSLAFKDLRMKSFRGIYFVGLLSMAYSLPTIKYAVTTGQLWYGVFALLPLIGAVGLFLRRSWARFPICLLRLCRANVGCLHHLVHCEKGLAILSNDFGISARTRSRASLVLRLRAWFLDRAPALSPMRNLTTVSTGPAKYGLALLCRLCGACWIEECLTR